MSENESELGAFMAGFVIGGLVGAATALILAPQSGAETRAQIAAKSDEIIQASEKQFVDYRDKAETAITQAQIKVQDSTEQVQERARIVLDEGKSRLQKDSKPENESNVEDQQVSEGDQAEATGDASA